MRRLLPIVFLLPTLLVAGAATAQSIKLEPTSLDFGKLKQMETRTAKVKVTNVGAGLLVIEDVRADCGCTVPELTTKALRAGESTELTVHFDSKSFSGPIHKLIKITSNDPDRRLVELPLAADIRAVLLVDPVSERVGFSSGLLGEVASRSVTFTAPDATLRLQADKTQKGLFDVKVVNGVDGDPQKARLEITRPARMKAGQHDDVVRVTTNVPERPSVDISMRATITGELSTHPEAVSFLYRPVFEQSVKVFAAKPPLDFKVTRVEIDLPEIKVQVVETVPRQETHIKLTGAPIPASDPRVAASKGRITGILRIHTNLKSLPVIEVPVSYMVRM